jgi:hypothetical protein
MEALHDEMEPLAELIRDTAVETLRQSHPA